MQPGVLRCAVMFASCCGAVVCSSSSSGFGALLLLLLVLLLARCPWGWTQGRAPACAGFAHVWLLCCLVWWDSAAACQTHIGGGSLAWFAVLCACQLPQLGRQGRSSGMQHAAQGACCHEYSASLGIWEAHLGCCGVQQQQSTCVEVRRARRGVAARRFGAWLQAVRLLPWHRVCVRTCIWGAWCLLSGARAPAAAHAAVRAAPGHVFDGQVIRFIVVRLLLLNSACSALCISCAGESLQLLA